MAKPIDMSGITVLIRLSIPFILGIFTAGYFHIHWPGYLLFVCAIGLFFLKSALFYGRMISGILVFMFFFGLGNFRFHETTPRVVGDGQFEMHAIVTSGEMGNSGKRRISISADAMYLCILPEEFVGVLLPGDSLHISGRVQSPSSFSFPFGFDKAAYFRSNGWSAEVYPDKLERLDSNFHWLRYPAKCSRWVNERIDGWEIRPDTKGFIAAMLSGDKVHLSSEMKRDFSSLGIAHVLAVSGLHIGLLYLILLKALFFLKGKHKRWRRTIALVFIWFFVVMTGAGPSAVRAGVMFSFFALSDWLNRPFSTGDALFTSAFVLLWYNPHWLFSAGFQLSYSALIGIVYLHPAIAKLNVLPFKLGSVVWNSASAALSAQLTTLPFLIYWFHSFPLYFLPANLILVPLLMLLMYGSIAALVFPFTFIEASLDKLVDVILWLVKFMQKLPGSVYNHLYWDDLSLFLLGMTITLALFTLVYRTVLWFKLALFGVCSFFAVLLLMQPMMPGLIFHKKGKGLAIEQVHEGFSTILLDEHFSRNSFYWEVETADFRKSCGIDSVCFMPLKNDVVLGLIREVMPEIAFDHYATLYFDGKFWCILECN